MVAKNPFDDLYDKITLFLNFVKTHSLSQIDADKIPDDIEKRFDKLERKLESFNKISEEIIRLSEVSDEEIKRRLEGTSDDVPEDGKELIQRGHEVKAEAEIINDKLEKALHNIVKTESYTALPPLPKDEKALDDKEYIKKRRSKFKRFGGNDTWKPL